MLLNSWKEINCSDNGLYKVYGTTYELYELYEHHTNYLEYVTKGHIATHTILL